MLRRKPTRVEDRADVADEYEQYAREKEARQSQSKIQLQNQDHSHDFKASADSAVAQSHAARQQTRSRIGFSAN